MGQADQSGWRKDDRCRSLPGLSNRAAGGQTRRWLLLHTAKTWAADFTVLTSRTYSFGQDDARLAAGTAACPADERSRG
jgi:hypothetical protein